MEHRTTRRTSVRIAALLGAGSVMRTSDIARNASAKLARERPIVGEAFVPAWTFSVLQFQDPYTGELLQPKDPKPGFRYVGAEVTIRNDSNAPLELATTSIRLVDYDGTQYSNSEVQGTEPRLRGFNMVGGETARGWIWIGVPQTAELAEMVYDAPAPRLRVPLPEDKSTPPSGTPVGE